MLQHFLSEMITATLIRYPDGAYVDGEWVSGTPVESSISIIAPQPVTPNDLQMLEDGEHVRDFLKTWTATEIRTREGNQDADELRINGKVYKVFQVSDRSTLGDYYRAIIRRRTDDE